MMVGRVTDPRWPTSSPKRVDNYRTSRYMVSRWLMLLTGFFDRPICELVGLKQWRDHHQTIAPSRRAVYA